MQTGKTKRGVLIRSAAGMKTENRDRAWCLVADRHRLCLFEKTRNEVGHSLELKGEFINPDGRKKGHDMVSDRPGRSFDSQDRSQGGQKGGTRHSYGSSYTPEQHAIDSLVREASSLLQAKGLTSEEGITLFVVAEPGLMGSLRASLQRTAPRCHIVFEENDYAWLAESQLKERLSSLLGLEST